MRCIAGVLIVFLQQHNATGSDDFFFANRPNAFAGLCFDVYLIDFEGKYFSDASSDCFFVWTQARFLCRHDAVEIDDLVASRLDLVVGQSEHLGRVTVFVF